MTPTAQPLLGLCPIGKFVFSHEAALAVKRDLQARLRAWQIPFVDLDGVLPDGLVREQAHVEPAVQHLRAAGVDAVFMPHCNFGTESAVGMIGRKLERPVLLWGPRDEAPAADGTRQRDTLCGLFASSRVLHALNVPFTYLDNTPADAPAFRAGVERFVRAVAVARLFRHGMRIGHVGQRIDFFWTTIVNEGELLERFRVEVLPLDMVAFLRAVKDRAVRGRAGYEAELGELRKTTDVEGFADSAPLVRILAVRDQLLALAQEHGLDGLAMQDFMSLVEEVGAYAFYANCVVGDRVPMSLESDLHGAVSCVLLHRAMLGQRPVFLSDLTVRHPQDDNGVLLWHAGAPLAMKHPEARVRLGDHWILPGAYSGMPHFRLQDGPVTVARFDGDRGAYRLAVGEAHTMPGPFTLNNYAWLRTDDWPRWERRLVEGPFIHHVAAGYEHVGGALVEACRYIPGLTAVVLNRPGAFPGAGVEGSAA